MSLTAFNLRKTALWLGLCALLGAVTATGLAADPLHRPTAFPDLVCNDSLDYRGDVNLNGLPYEVADFQLFADYFLNGISVFTIDPNRQIPATDVNADGVVLAVGDLVYLGLIIEGLANPYPKVLPGQDEWVRFYPDGDTLRIDAPCSLGAVYMVFEGEVQPALCQTGAQIMYNYNGSFTRVLILGDNGFRPAKLVSGPLVSIPSVKFPTSAETCDTLGQPLRAVLDSPTDVADNGTRLPAGFYLGQNYPNPFNPTTAISFSLPRAASYSLSIYSITGQRVAFLSGTGGPGWVTEHWDASGYPSGVYLYRLVAGTLTDSRKMLLLK